MTDTEHPRVRASEDPLARMTVQQRVVVRDRMGFHSASPEHGEIDYVELRDGKHVFTDYMSLYKVGDDWKIVGKIFHRHR